MTFFFILVTSHLVPNPRLADRSSLNTRKVSQSTINQASPWHSIALLLLLRLSFVRSFVRSYTFALFGFCFVFVNTHVAIITTTPLLRTLLSSWSPSPLYLFIRHRLLHPAACSLGGRRLCFHICVHIHSSVKLPKPSIYPPHTHTKMHLLALRRPHARSAARRSRRRPRARADEARLVEERVPLGLRALLVVAPALRRPVADAFKVKGRGGGCRGVDGEINTATNDGRQSAGRPPMKMNSNRPTPLLATMHHHRCTTHTTHRS